MMQWLVFALMTVAAVFAVLWPLRQRDNRAQADGSETAVYRDQLMEVDRDVAIGLIGPPEAAAARVEISRRLLAAADIQRAAPLGSSLRLRRVTALVALIGVPIIALGLYLPLGSPGLPDFPLAQRASATDATRSLDTLWLRSSSTWRITPPTAGDGACWRRCLLGL